MLCIAVSCLSVGVKGLECTILKWNDKIIEVQLPNKLEFKVSDVRVSGSAKTAILDCGLDVVVPSFIKIGDLIVIGSEDLKYIGRAE